MIRTLLMSIAALALVTVASVPPAEAGSNVRASTASKSKPGAQSITVSCGPGRVAPGPKGR